MNKVQNMNKTELARLLAEMYNNASHGDKSAMIHLFGVRYAKEIRKNDYTPLEIITEARETYGAEITDNFKTEIHKMINLSKYVVDKEKIIQCIN